MSYSRFYLYSLPQSLLDTLVHRTIGAGARLRAEAKSEFDVPDPTRLDHSHLGSRSCNVCLNASFFDVENQRDHFRSDWHRYNVKLRLAAHSPVSEDHFATLVDNLEDSLSGSASSDFEGTSSSDDAVSTLMSRAHVAVQSRSPSPEAKRPTQMPIIWFHTPGCDVTQGQPTQLGFYRVLFPQSAGASEQVDYMAALRAMQGPVRVQDPESGETIQEGRTWALFMIAGGHFAGAIVRVGHFATEPAAESELSSGKRKKKPPKQEPETEFLLHKTFHRYTTRRKQGGSQSTQDNTRFAKSAGAQLRRYGEQALREDVQALLTAWAGPLSKCTHIFLRANTSNKRIFTDWDDAPVKKGDPRWRGWPFPTRRPTQSELARCLAELVRSKVEHKTEEELKQLDEEYLDSLRPKKLPPAPAQPTPIAVQQPTVTALKLTPEQESARNFWLRATEMVSKTRIDALRTLLERNSISVDTRVPSYVGGTSTGRTLLHIASREGRDGVVKWLLEEASADPGLPICPSDEDPDQAESEVQEQAQESEQDLDGSDVEQPVRVHGSKRTAYDIARTRAVRAAFRAAAQAAPEKWDWSTAGHVPTGGGGEAREEKRKARRKGLREKAREREREMKAREKQHEAEQERLEKEGGKNENEERKLVAIPESGPRKLGGAMSGTSKNATEGLVGLTPEMRAKIERERRARAAEARLKGR